MKFPFRSLPIAVAVLTANFAFSTIATAAIAQEPQGPPPGAGPGAGGPPPGPRTFPPPTNLKVLPKNLNGQQVRDIMEIWEGSLGVHCNTCHAADPKNVGPNGRPRMNFADDSKPEKNTARLMFTMMQGINKDYIMKIEGAEKPVTCGTCHRGHLDPEPYVIPEEEHGPRPPQGAPSGPPPAQH